MILMANPNSPRPVFKQHFRFNQRSLRHVKPIQAVAGLYIQRIAAYMRAKNH